MTAAVEDSLRAPVPVSETTQLLAVSENRDLEAQHTNESASRQSLWQTLTKSAFVLAKSTQTTVAGASLGFIASLYGYPAGRAIVIGGAVGSVIGAGEALQELQKHEANLRTADGIARAAQSIADVAPAVVQAAAVMQAAQTQRVAEELTMTVNSPTTTSQSRDAITASNSR
jgi:hypothetical protein